MRDKTRAYVGNRFYLDLDRAPAGWLLTSEGGQASTESVNERLAGGHPVRKHAGNVKVDDISITCGAAMSKPFYEWLAKSLAYDYTRKDGAIVTCDYDYQELARLDFAEALIAEVGFPALDASSKEPGKFNLKIATEYTEMKYSQGNATYQAPIFPEKQKRWTAANFRLQIDGMDTKRVLKVDAITIKQNIVENAIGERLMYQKEPAQIDFPSLVITIAGKRHRALVQVAQSRSSWTERARPRTKNPGASLFLQSNIGNPELFSLSFAKILVLSSSHRTSTTPSSDKLRYVRIEMYCEAMTFYVHQLT